MVNPAISPALTVRAIYSDAEIAMLESITRRLARGIDKPGWQVAKLADLTAVRADLEHQIAVAAAQGVSAVSNGVASTYTRAANLAIADLPSGVAVAFGQGGRRDAILALAREASGLLTATDSLILRSGVDVYRTVVANAAGTVLTGARTRLEAAQVELDRFAARGVTSFVDRAGRSWDMASYAEMATRTAVNRAGRAGYRDTLEDRGYDLVIVSGTVATCNLCAPWEGEILSLHGATAGYPTVSDAEGAGLHHPNCGHREDVYLPGITRLDRSQVTAADQAEQEDNFNATQQQRANERQIRTAKRAEATALTPEARALAGKDVRAAQAVQRAHIAAHDDILRRQPSREQIVRAR